MKFERRLDRSSEVPMILDMMTKEEAIIAAMMKERINFQIFLEERFK